ncbi:MAG TPA: hypothetical protein VGQ05_24760, partial [Streptosporangiaceae bacterium]|nr:hypothetical protein [Streptosporangiaceae bacterium]
MTTVRLASNRLVQAGLDDSAVIRLPQLAAVGLAGNRLGWTRQAELTVIRLASVGLAGVQLASSKPVVAGLAELSVALAVVWLAGCWLAWLACLSWVCGPGGGPGWLRELSCRGQRGRAEGHRRGQRASCRGGRRGRRLGHGLLDPGPRRRGRPHRRQLVVHRARRRRDHDRPPRRVLRRGRAHWRQPLLAVLTLPGRRPIRRRAVARSALGT